MSIDIDVTQIRKLERDLTDGSIKARTKARNAVRKAGLEIERGAKQRAPVRTGMLRGSISTSFEGSNMDVARAQVGPEVNYGHFLELGTERMSPRPYLGPAFDAVEPSFLQALRDIDPLGGH